MSRRLMVLGFALCAAVLLASPAFAQIDEFRERQQDAFSGYKPIYFLIGLGELVPESGETFGSQPVKISFSMKYELFHQWNTGIFLGYSQIMFWDFFDESRPFSELNYNPELFFRFQSGDNFAGNVDIPFIDYFQIGVEHKSTGLAGEGSQGWDRVYLDVQAGIGNDLFLGVGVKTFALFEDIFPVVNDLFDTNIVYPNDNPGIGRFLGQLEANATVDFGGNMPAFLPQRITLRSSFGALFSGSPELSWAELNLFFFDFGGVRPMIQVYYGYTESLINFSNRGLSVRAGIALN